MRGETPTKRDLGCVWLLLSGVLGLAGLWTYHRAGENPPPWTSAPMDVDLLIVALVLLAASLVCFVVAFLSEPSGSGS